jgi:large subunit ribosomal protein L17
MRHQKRGRKLGRDAAHRKALYANLCGSLIEHGRIRTTEAKAKEVRPIVEEMITLGKRGDIHAHRQAVAFLRSKEVAWQLFNEVAPRFADRPGGYTRVVKIGPRQGDAAPMAYLELVDYVAPARTAPVPAAERAAQAAS